MRYSTAHNAKRIARKGAEAQRPDDMFTRLGNAVVKRSRADRIFTSPLLCVFASLRETFWGRPFSVAPLRLCAIPRARRLSGFTLIEMLIVVTIMMILVGMTATVFRPANDSRRVREAARAVNVYLSTARNRAMETGRPCGVMLRRFNNSAAVMNLDQCEVPPCYAGETEQSFASVWKTGEGTVSAILSDGVPPNMVRRGDVIQFNCQGPYYYITNNNDASGFVPNATLTLTYDATGGQLVPWPTTSPGVNLPYRIYRSPVKSAATPLQLPATTVIDLNTSGTDSFTLTGTGTVIIVFAPNGSVLQVYDGNGNVKNVTEPIYLLVGRRERVGNTYVANPTPSQMTNWQDTNNLWVVINPQTGLVTTGNVVAASDVAGSRVLARQAQSMGGK